MSILKLTSRFSGLYLLLTLLGTSGCTTIVDGVTDSAFDETDGRQIKSDYRRLYSNEPLKYHRTEGDLRRHAIKERAEDAWFDDPWLDEEDK